MGRGRLSAIVLAIGATVCLAVTVHIGLIGIASLHDWTIIYLGLPAGLGFLLLAALTLKPAHRSSAALSVGAAVIAMLAADIYLVITNLAVVQSTRPTGDIRSVREVVRDLRAAGRPAYPVLSGRTLLTTQTNGTLGSRIVIDGRETLPLGGISGVLTVYCNEDGSFLIYTSDEHGFHNPPGLWARPRLDIAAVGDSFTHGACVPSDRNMVAEVRRHFPATLNLGMAGNGPLSELAAIKEYLPRRRPRVVLWFYFEGNDISKDLFIEREATSLVAYLDQGFTQSLELHQAAIDDALAAEAEKAYETPSEDPSSRLSQVFTTLDILLLRHLRHALGMAVGRADIPLFRRVMAEANRTVAAWGGRLYFVYLPSEARYLGLGGRIAQSSLRARVLATVRDLGIPIIDIHAAFAQSPAPQRLFQGHFSPEGYAIAARSILSRLAADGVVPEAP